MLASRVLISVGFYSTRFQAIPRTKWEHLGSLVFTSTRPDGVQVKVDMRKAKQKQNQDCRSFSETPGSHDKAVREPTFGRDVSIWSSLACTTQEKPKQISAPAKGTRPTKFVCHPGGVHCDRSSGGTFNQDFPQRRQQTEAGSLALTMLVGGDNCWREHRVDPKRDRGYLIPDRDKSRVGIGFNPLSVWIRAIELCHPVQPVVWAGTVYWGGTVQTYQLPTTNNTAHLSTIFISSDIPTPDNQQHSSPIDYLHQFRHTNSRQPTTQLTYRLSSLAQTYQLPTTNNTAHLSTIFISSDIPTPDNQQHSSPIDYLH
ncbi:hypothetical protein RRG08_060977 [Elysia crispata]|uniref:Uncharacterized protein n=1 Tax=Elysia crispata TaxID=231223 RepID=A0AAE1AWT9_9GAST|nr:hypothetical protein RRG08_060977 [Elysia crispata]